MASQASTDRRLLCLVVDRSIVAIAVDLERSVEAAVRAGVDRVQLRERALGGEAWLTWADGLVAAARRGRNDVQISVNRRLDVACCLSLEAVHLGFDAVSIATARALVGTHAVVGTSVHSVDEVRAARGADYVHLAPIFAPRSKPASRPPLGLPALRAATAIGIPVIAQGGIDEANCRDVVGAGAAGIAVTGSILLADDPGRAARLLREALDDQP